MVQSCSNEISSIEKYRRLKFESRSDQERVFCGNMYSVLKTMTIDSLYHSNREYFTSDLVVIDFHTDPNKRRYFGWFISKSLHNEYYSTGFIGYENSADKNWYHYLFDQGEFFNFKDIKQIEIESNNYFLGEDFKKSVLIKYGNSSQVPDAVYNVGFTPDQDVFWDSPLWNRNICSNGRFLFEHVDNKCKGKLSCLLLPPVITSSPFSTPFIMY